MGVPVGCAVVRADGYDSQLRLVANFSNRSLSAETGEIKEGTLDNIRLCTLVHSMVYTGTFDGVH